MKTKLLKVWIEHAIDTDPDLSWLGDYGKNPKSEFSIDRKARGDMGSRQYQFFNPGSVEKFRPDAEWLDDYVTLEAKRMEWHKAMEQNAEKDYQRMEAYNAQQWCMIGVIAKAEVQLQPNGPIQVLRSGGLWGVESDGKSYLGEVAKEQLAELKTELLLLGCGERAIVRAFQQAETVNK